MKRREAKRTKTGFWVAAAAILCIAGAALGAWFAGYAYRLSETVRHEFRPGQWPLPATIYARPLTLYPGKPVQMDRLVYELKLMQYVEAGKTETPRTYHRQGNIIEIHSGRFQVSETVYESEKYRIAVEGDRIQSICNASGAPVSGPVGLEPAVIGHFSTDHYEDRIPLSIEETPDLLIQTLIQVEDRDFYNHSGISITGVLRAMIANIKAGSTVQGGSTLTQQLIKNMFLVRNKSYKRKLDEMIMAVFLERHATKKEILEAYINEVYMGQDGKRAIHGFGLAARYYFNRPAGDLKTHEIALLAGLLKGPSYYDPVRFPDRALERRNRVLETILDGNLINKTEYMKAVEQPLSIHSSQKGAAGKFPAYMDLVKRRLSHSYQEDALKTGGLRIFTHFDPQIQTALETSIAETLRLIEIKKGLPKNGLEASAIVTDTADGAILAAAGGRKAGIHGYNRALDARRAIGSLIKPVIYLTALSKPEKYHLMTFIDDAPIEVKTPSGKIWRPRNYDHVSHGPVPLYQALSHSYNQAAVRLGLDIGVKEVLTMLATLGYKHESPAYPSALLGSVPMSVTDAAQVYQTLAAGGLYTPIRAIRSVYSSEGKLLTRFQAGMQHAVDANYVYLLNKALQTAVTGGTAAELPGLLNKDLNTAGKTGTTNDFRDSWFAGFTGNRAAVIWVGRDDNKPCGLSGADGAMRIWGDLFNHIYAEPLVIHQPELITWGMVDRENGMLVDPSCQSAVSMPFIIGFGPAESGPCSAEPERSLFKWLKQIFQ